MHEPDDHVDAVEDIPQGKRGFPKSKDGLARGFGGNRLLESFCRREIHAGAQHVREAVFDVDHVQKRQTPPGRELGYDIHIRHLADSRPPCVGAMQEQVLNASGFQLTFVFPQFGNDRGLIHTAAPFCILSHPKQPRIIGGARREIRPRKAARASASPPSYSNLQPEDFDQFPDLGLVQGASFLSF
jgi:hypothetical protein